MGEKRANTVRNAVESVLSKPIPEKQRKQVEAILGELPEEEDNLLTMAVAGMVEAAAGGNVSAFNALMEFYSTDKPNESKATVLSIVQNDRARKSSAAHRDSA